MVCFNLEKFFLTHGKERTYWIAYSGGLDSHVLLHTSAKLRETFSLNIKAIHINHQLSPNANQWMAHCAEICRDLKIELIQKTIHIQSVSGDSPEEIARALRYNVFSELLLQDDFLLTAHQKDDQAETVLLQLLRGAGPKGLAAMPHIKPFFKGFHARPFLSIAREDLKNYADQHQLHWIEDESNANTDFTRNFLRHDVLPLLKKRWPTVTKTLSRVADNCGEAQKIIENIAEKELAEIKDNNTLSIKKLLQLEDARQRQVLRMWLMQLNFPLPSAIKLRQIQRDFLQARIDKLPSIRWKNVELRRYRDTLYAFPLLKKHDPTQIFQWNFTQPLMIPNIGLLEAAFEKTKGLSPDLKNITVRFRQGGERCRLAGRKCHHDLKKLFQEW